MCQIRITRLAQIAQPSMQQVHLSRPTSYKLMDLEIRDPSLNKLALQLPDSRYGAATWGSFQRSQLERMNQFAGVYALVSEEKAMIRFIRKLSVPASDSHLGLALGVAAVAMALMLWAIVWQANVIAYQRDLIHWMTSARIGG
jgi:hypothetical protein